MHQLATERLTLRPIADGDRDLLHALAADAHVRRFLLDGREVDVAWAAAQVAASRRRFEQGALGLWLARLGPDGERVGFGGFLGPDRTHQLAYAVRGADSGIGLGSELAAALVRHATTLGVGDLQASVDAVNAASVRILERLGFSRTAVQPGAFGELWTYARRA